MKTCLVSIYWPVTVLNVKPYTLEKQIPFNSPFELALQLRPLLGDLPKGTKINLVIA